MMGAQANGRMSGEKTMKPRSLSSLLVVVLAVLVLTSTGAWGQVEPPAGCGAAQSVGAEDCLRCHVVPGFDPASASLEQAASMSASQGPLAASSASGRVTTWEVMNVDEQTYRLHWEVNGYVMRFSIYRHDEAADSWSMVYDKWPWGRLPSEWDNMFPMPPLPAAMKGAQPITFFRQVIYCASGAPLCGTGWIYDPPLSVPPPAEAVVAVPAAGASTKVEVLADNQYPYDNTKWGPETNLDTYHVNPAPRNEYTRIRYLLPAQGDNVVLTITNTGNGQVVYAKADAQVKPGVYYEHQWDGKLLALGQSQADPTREKALPGLYQVSIAVNGGAPQGSPQILLLGPDPLKSTIGADREYIAADGMDIATLTVTLKDGKNQPLSDAAGWQVGILGPGGQPLIVTPTGDAFAATFSAAEPGQYVFAATAWRGQSEVFPVCASDSAGSSAAQGMSAQAAPMSLYGCASKKVSAVKALIRDVSPASFTPRSLVHPLLRVTYDAVGPAGTVTAKATIYIAGDHVSPIHESVVGLGTNMVYEWDGNPNSPLYRTSIDPYADDYAEQELSPLLIHIGLYSSQEIAGDEQEIPVKTLSRFVADHAGGLRNVEIDCADWAAYLWKEYCSGNAEATDIGGGHPDLTFRMNGSYPDSNGNGLPDKPALMEADMWHYNWSTDNLPQAMENVPDRDEDGVPALSGPKTVDWADIRPGDVIFIDHTQGPQHPGADHTVVVLEVYENDAKIGYGTYNRVELDGLEGTTWPDEYDYQLPIIRDSFVAWFAVTFSEPNQVIYAVKRFKGEQ